MCLTIPTNDYKIETAAEDVYVYKIVNVWGDGSVVSFFQNFKYRRGWEYSIGQDLDSVAAYYDGYLRIYKAFHSFGQLKAELELQTNANYVSYYKCPNSAIKLMCFIIPKGSQYCEFNGCYASNRIKLPQKDILIKYILESTSKQ